VSNKFSYEKSRKTHPGKDFLNFQNFLLVGARSITRLLFYTPVTPHQVIFASMCFGMLGAYLIIQDNRVIVFVGALCLFYKNVLDKVDGSLARAKGLVSRRGRFYDSLSDFIVSLAIFAAIAVKLSTNYPAPIFIVCFVAFVFSMLQCSCFIYYQVAFIKFTGGKTVNRLIESVTHEDRKNQDKFTLLLQNLFMIIYGWQDILVSKLDDYQRTKLADMASLKGIDAADPVGRFINIWYAERTFLSILSLLSIGSHVVLIAVFAVAGKFEYYLFLNLIIWNLILLFAVFYHYYSAKKLLRL
jgi:phosphatidylglycerophosphate synthase